jgi:anhydro-N-acetylmuramic acid kinase
VDLHAQPKLLGAETYPLPPALHAELLSLCQPGPNEIERMGRADRALGFELANAVNRLLKETGIVHASVRAIGSHGQTIRHRPADSSQQPYPFTLQIGDPTTIAQLTGITTVADFRRRDIAAGGQGAPLVPAFHRAVFGNGKGGDRARVILNIGGIANITALRTDGAVFGFDTGPGNTLLDAWINRHQQQPFDRDGAWAATGKIHTQLLSTILAEPFLAAAPPKSTGRELFNLAWLDAQLAQQNDAINPADVQATLVELTASSIATAIGTLPFTPHEIFVCGGGAYNRQLMLRLETLLHPRQLGSTAQLGIAPEWVEAAAFAWLAQQTLAGKPGNEPTVTGAEKYCTLGAIYPA